MVNQIPLNVVVPIIDRVDGASAVEAIDLRVDSRSGQTKTIKIGIHSILT